MTMFKILVSLILGLLGPYFMYRGKKTQNIKMVLVGAAILVLSYFVFSGSSDDKASQDALKGLMPGNGIPTTPGEAMPVMTPGQTLP